MGVNSRCSWKLMSCAHGRQFWCLVVLFSTKCFTSFLTSIFTSFYYSFLFAAAKVAHFCETTKFSSTFLCHARHNDNIGAINDMIQVSEVRGVAVARGLAPLCNKQPCYEELMCTEAREWHKGSGPLATSVIDKRIYRSFSSTNVNIPYTKRTFCSDWQIRRNTLLRKGRYPFRVGSARSGVCLFM